MRRLFYGGAHENDEAGSAAATGAVFRALAENLQRTKTFGA